MNKVALIIIYNHRFDENIAIVEQIYKSRFSHLYHLVPFYDGEKDNVIPVYENSFYFQGYVAQGFKSYFKEEYTHYFFIADDMILNPIINENNYAISFQLDNDTNFIPGFFPFEKGFWYHNIEALKYNPRMCGVEAVNFLPSKEEATRILAQQGCKNSPFSYRTIYGNCSIKNYLIDKYIEGISFKKGVKYPLAASYSDIFIVAKSNVEKFIQYCGIFAATELWVEVAIPTAMALTANKIKQEKDLSLQGRALWSEADSAILESYQNNLDALLQNFPKSYIYLHPIKLSKWKTEKKY